MSNTKKSRSARNAAARFFEGAMNQVAFIAKYFNIEGETGLHRYGVCC